MNPVTMIASMGTMLTLVSCHSSNDTPPPPPVPAGYVQYVGHWESTSLFPGPEQNVWYAYYFEAADSSAATLMVGIRPGDLDTAFLVRDTNSSTGWNYAPNNSRYSTPPLGFPTLQVTADSVTLEEPIANKYFLKKQK